jgi:hypothetical protein
VAHLVTAVAAPGELGRRRAVRRTVAGAAAGLLLALPLVALTWANGRGPEAMPRQVTPVQLGDVFLQLFAERRPDLAGAVLVLAAAALGAARAWSGRSGDVARLALAWAVVPPAVLFPLVWARPELLTHRYLLFVVPGWAILAGLGLVTVAEHARRLLLAAGAPRAGAVAGRATVVAALAATAALQAATLADLRLPDGHGEDIRPALRAARTGDRAGLPLVFSPRAAVELAPYARDDEARLLGIRAQRTTRSIWPATADPAEQARLLRDSPRLVLLLRSGQDPPCRWRESGDVAAYVTRCMPPELRGHQVTDAVPAGRQWTVATLTR